MYRLSAKIWFEILHTRSRHSVIFPVDSVNAVLHSPYFESHCKDTIPKFETKIHRKGIARSQFPHSCVSERFIYSHNRSAYSAAEKYVDRSWEYINRSQTHECGNWDISHAIPYLGIYKWVFRCSAGRNKMDAESVKMLRETPSCWFHGMGRAWCPLSRKRTKEAPWNLVFTIVLRIRTRIRIGSRFTWVSESGSGSSQANIFSPIKESMKRRHVWRAFNNAGGLSWAYRGLVKYFVIKNLVLDPNPDPD